MMFRILKMKVKQMMRMIQKIIIIKKIVMKNLFSKIIFNQNN